MTHAQFGFVPLWLVHWDRFLRGHELVEFRGAGEVVDLVSQAFSALNIEQGVVDEQAATGGRAQLRSNRSEGFVRRLSHAD